MTNNDVSLQSRKREVAYAIGGMLLGVMAPIGWTLLRLILFWDEQRGLVDQIVADILVSDQSLALYLYMGVGTAMVLGTFGFFIGRTTEQIQERARRLDRLNREVDEQKQSFERRFTDLDHSIKNFHVINTDLQKSVNLEEVLRLAANGLHEVIGYDRINILMVSEDETELRIAVSRGIKLDNAPADARIPLDERAGCIFTSVRDRQVMLIEDITKMPKEYHLKPPCDALPQLRSKSFILCPIVVRGKTVGVFGVDNKYKRRKLEETDVDTVKLFADQISASIMRINLLDAVESLTVELEATFREFLKHREEHDRLIQSLREAVASSSSATADINGGAGVIQESINSTRSAVGEISVSIGQVSSSLKTLSDFMERSIAAMTEIQYTISAVEENSVRSHSMSETVKSRAEHGVETVDRVLEGMQGIVSSVEQTEEIIRQLSEKGEEVGSVTSVVAELTQKTSLLALNAAIIAAQAGEHGRSFAVVADEVRSLAQEAAVSTDRIDRIIEEIQSFTRQTVEHIGRTRNLVDQGLQQGEDMAGVLGQILDSSHQAMEMAHEIRTSTQEISQAVNGVSKSVEELGEMSTQVTQASREEASGAQSIVSAVEEVKSMTEDMVQATAQQRENTKQIDKVVDQVSDMARRIFDEMDERRAGSLEVIEDLRLVKQKDLDT